MFKPSPVLVDFQIIRNVVFHSLPPQSFADLLFCQTPLSQNVKWPCCFNTEMWNISSYCSLELQSNLNNNFEFLSRKLVISNSFLYRLSLCLTQNWSACIDCKRIYRWVGLNSLSVQNSLLGMYYGQSDIVLFSVLVDLNIIYKSSQQ